MFTGIVREVGHVVEASGRDDGLDLGLEAEATAAETGAGDSIALDGVCLTAERVDGATITFHAVPETVSRTTLGTLGAGAAVNVEPALRAGDPFGGHLVQGHVDGVGTVLDVGREGAGMRVMVGAPADVLRYCVVKGSITVAGVSLTIAELRDDAFGFVLVPHTCAATTLGGLAPGEGLNLEVDVLAKYVERLLAGR